MNRPDPEIGVVVLAAGKSSRFDGHKLLALLDGVPVMEWALRAAETAGFSRRYLITPVENSQSFARSGWEIIANTNAERGLSTSIIAGLSKAAECERIVLALADMPFVTAAHLASLAGQDGVVFTRYPDGHPGCPAAFPKESFPALLALRGDRGAASIDFPGMTLLDPADPAILADIDTRADLDRLSDPNWTSETKRRLIR